jgi:hypothetical protein
MFTSQKRIDTLIQIMKLLTIALEVKGLNIRKKLEFVHLNGNIVYTKLSGHTINGCAVLLYS